MTGPPPHRNLTGTPHEAENLRVSLLHTLPVVRAFLANPLTDGHPDNQSM